MNGFIIYYGTTSKKVHNNLKCSNNSKHCQWSGIKRTEHTCIWSMKTINILVHINFFYHNKEISRMFMGQEL